MSLKDDITVLPSNIQDELNAGSTCEECAEALSDYIIKLQADNKVLTAKVKELEKGHEADVRQINYLDQREVELINKIVEFVKGTEFGVADVLASSIAGRFIKMGGRHQLTTNRGKE